MKVNLTVLLASLFVLNGCGSQRIADYNETQPNLSLSQYFDGPITAWGMVQDYNDKVTRRFCVEMTGRWQSNNGQLAETFYFDDGEISYRTWQLKKEGNKYSGTAEDVSGVAYGQTNGYAFQWQYTLNLNIDGTEYEFFLDDWMYQLDNYRVFNKTSMTKFGVQVAELTIFFDKQQPLRTCAS